MTCVSNIKLRDLVSLVQDNLKPEAIGAVNTLNGEATNLSLSGDIKLDEQAVEALCQQLEGCLGAQIDDTDMTSEATWSSDKIQLEITRAIRQIINGADPDSDTLKELAEQLKRLAEADAGLATKESVSALEDKIEALEVPDMSGFATKESVSEVDAKVEAIEEDLQQTLKIDDIKLSNGYIAYYEQ